MGMHPAPTRRTATTAAPWWQRAALYQVYPRSFQDSNGDGVGDLEGIRRRLAYLERLGVGAIWLSPIYPSPMDDFGYDVSDYIGIDPDFGDLEAFRGLLDEVHARGLRLVLDFVPNHTSDRHPWFRESRASRDSARRDWYLWHDPRPDGGPPNNWLSVFGGSAWEWDATTEQYYYHAFLPTQPDLNWRNPDVRTAMYDVLRHWLDLGVDGFRVDVMWHLIKDDELRDNPLNPDWTPDELQYHRYSPVYSTDQPEVHEVVREMRAVLEEYDGDRLLIGEIYLPIDRLVLYYGEDGSGAHMPFNFQLIELDWDARVLERAIDEYEGSLPDGAWPNWVIGNHDRPRIASRVGFEQARVAALLLLCLRGTPILYYGDELGMTDVEIPPERARDPVERREPGKGRDPQRTPMRWTAEPKAGFTEGEAWLPIGNALERISVEAETEDPGSMLSLYRRLLALRASEPALLRGRHRSVPHEGDVLAFLRETGGSRLYVALNLGSREADASLPAETAVEEVLASTDERPVVVAGSTLRLAGDQGAVLRLASE